MKKLAIIGASYLQIPLVQKASEMGIYTICFAWEDGAVCKEYCDKYYPISIIEKEAILEICEEEKIEGICTIASDVAAPTVAYVAKQMGLVGNSYECAVRANNKYLMREALSKSKVLCPQYKMVRDVSDVAADEWEYPLIVKPSDRSGSLGVMKVYNQEELMCAVKVALEFSFKKEAMIEQFIDGREISVEFISYQGTHYPLQITDKVTTEAPHFVELEHHQPANLTEEMFENIFSVTRNALHALDITNGASHTEYKITDDGRLYIMEVGARMGGDFIGSDLVRLSTGYDFVKGVIEVALGNFDESSIIKLQSSKQKHCGVFFLCKNTAHLLPIIDSALRQPNLYPGIVEAKISDRELKDVACSAQRSGYIIYQSDSKMELK